jgi:hypothetical protein
MCVILSPTAESNVPPTFSTSVAIENLGAIVNAYLKSGILMQTF